MPCPVVEPCDTFRYFLGRRAFKHDVGRYWPDDESADYSDETKVDRRGLDACEAGLQPFQRELSTVVEAVVGADLSAAWIAPLRRAAGNANPMKWDDVTSFVMHGTGSESIAARNGLAAQVLIVTDPFRTVRRLDLAANAEGRLGIPYAAFLFGGNSVRGTKHLAGAPGPALGGALRRLVLENTLDSSGLGLLCERIAQADSREVDGDPRRRGAARSALMASVSGQLGGSLNKAAKLASKATALTAPIIDPDHPGGDRVRRQAEVFAEAGSWGTFDWLVAQEALGVVAERRLVVDRGHQDITNLTARLRDMAEVHAQGPDFDRAQAFEALRDERAQAAHEGRGYVRAGDDRRHLQLQVADVVAGWGRTIIADPRRGYRELARIFRCVLYNGAQLTPERAARLDEEITEHRKLVASFVVPG